MADDKQEIKTRDAGDKKPGLAVRESPAVTRTTKLFAIIVVIALIAVSFYAVFLFWQDGSDDNGGPVTENELPIANAGGNRELYTLESLSLSGSMSYDPDGEIVSFIWYFGDGFSSTDANTSHVYKKSGLYLLQLTVTDDMGENSTDTAYIKVLNRKPVLNIDVKSAMNIYSAHVFNGTASDPDGFISLYEWDFDGDGIYDWYAKTTGATTHFYEEEGQFTATFRVVDDRGDYNATSVQITVYPLPNFAPFVDAGPDQKAGVGPVTLFATVVDRDGDAVSYCWDFDGDGVFDWNSSENMEVTHHYALEGKYRALFRATDSGGLFGEDTVDITIDNSIIIEKVSATVLADWNSSSGKTGYNYFIKFNNSFTPENITVYVKLFHSADSQKLLYPDGLVLMDNRTLYAISDLAGGDEYDTIIQVFYLEQLISQRTIRATADFAKQLLSKDIDQSAEYSYNTDIYIDEGDMIRQENHSGRLKVISASHILQNYYTGAGTLKLVNDIEGSRTIFDISSGNVMRNETWQEGRLVQDSFVFTGTGRYKFTSTQGASFDIKLDEFVLNEQNGNKTDYHFSGSGTYENPPLEGTIDIEYDLLGLDIHDNWEGNFFNCEMYKIETRISYELSGTEITVHNTSFVWIVSEDTPYDDTTIYVEYVFRYSENNFVFEQKSDKYYPRGAPKPAGFTPNILDAIEFGGIVPISFSTGDRAVVESELGLMMEYESIAESQEQIKSYSYTVSEISGEVTAGGIGTVDLKLVSRGKYAGWVISKTEDYRWGSDIYRRSLELL